MFNRRAAAFKPSLFSRVCLLLSATPASPPVQMAGIWMLNFCLNVSFEKWNLKDELFVCTFKCLRGPILPASLKTSLSYPIQKPPILGGWGVDEEWNVPKWWFQQIEIPVVLKLIIVARVELSTKKARKKLCARTVSVVTVRPVNSWPWRHGGHFGIIRPRLFMSSIKLENREIRLFHVIIMQWRLRNVQKSALHMQSCCFALIKLIVFFRSRCRRVRRC